MIAISTTKIEKKEKEIKKLFQNDDSFLIKDVYSAYDKKLLCKICFINGLSNPNLIGELIIKPLLAYGDVKNFITTGNIAFEKDLDKAINKMLTGDCIVLTADDEYLIVDVKNNIFRSVSEPVNESLINGPRDGFIENILINVSLVRRRIRTHKFKVNYITLNSNDNGMIALVYVEDIVDQKALSLIKKRINNNLDSLSIDSNLLRDRITDFYLSPYKGIGDTERPDVLAFKLLEGKIGIICDGSPMVLYAPYLFYENFHTVDDYYVNYLYASVNRIIRFTGYFLSIVLPGAYICLITYHQELIPTKLALSIQSSRQGVPFPSTLEVLVLQLAFEVLKEAGTKIPTALGTSLSIVGTLIIGQATVEAKLISISSVIVVALASVTGLINRKLNTSTIIFRLFLIIMSALLGINGLIIGSLLLVIYVNSLESFERNYVTEMFSFNVLHVSKTYFKYPNRKKE